MIEFVFAGLGTLLFVGSAFLVLCLVEEANNWWNYRR
jgi:hypothetical protein